MSDLLNSTNKESLRKIGRHWEVNEINVLASNDTRQTRIRQATSCIQDTNNRWHFFCSVDSSPKSTMVGGLQSHQSPEPLIDNRSTFSSCLRECISLYSLCCFNSSSWSSMLPTRIRAEKRQLKHLVSDIFRSIGCSSWLGMAFFRCLGWTNISGSDCNGSITILISE
jgi:hypothetical protein